MVNQKFKKTNEMEIFYTIGGYTEQANLARGVAMQLKYSFYHAQVIKINTVKKEFDRFKRFWNTFCCWGREEI